MSTHLFRSALDNASRAAVRNVAPANQTIFTYSDMLSHASVIAQRIQHHTKHHTQTNSSYAPRVTLLIPPSFEIVASLYAVWSQQCICVPLCTSHPTVEMDYYMKDSESSLLVAHSSFAKQAQELCQLNNAECIVVDDMAPLSSNSSTRIADENFADNAMRSIDNSSASVFIYTSGTTSKPKGVVHTHDSLWSNIQVLNNEWHWHTDDSILNVLPMHHIHGLVNISLCALSNGALLTFDSPNPLKILSHFANNQDLTLFMAVPTVYAKLIQALEQMPYDQQQHYIAACRRLRLFVSGSAALPDSVMKRWHELTGHWLLERYGMTEILMCLSNKYSSAPRKPATVGFALPSVETKLAADGELLVKCPWMFKEYYNRPQQTAQEFTSDGAWFRTGDCVSVDEDGYFKIEGRKKVDIIKHGGYKISALDVERELREHPSVEDVAVLGIPDEVYGQTIAALVVLKTNPQARDVTQHMLQEWATHRMAKYKIPQQWLLVDEIPKNAMGKVNKTNLLCLFVPGKDAVK